MKKKEIFEVGDIVVIPDKFGNINHNLVVLNLVKSVKKEDEVYVSYDDYHNYDNEDEDDITLSGGSCSFKINEVEKVGITTEKLRRDYLSKEYIRTTINGYKEIISALRDAKEERKSLKEE